MALVNKVFSWMMKKRAHQMELFIKYPHEVQAEVLRKLLDLAKDTTIGIQHNFKDITDYQQFSSRLPVVNYEEIEEDLLKIKDGAKNYFWPSEIKWFAKSSGTTNSKSKFIPVSKEAIEDCHFKGGKDMLSIYCNHFPKTQIYKGKSLMVGGSKTFNDVNNGSFYGDLSAIIISNVPFWVSLRRTPDRETVFLGEWEDKLERMANQTIDQNISNISGVPSWTLVLLNKVLEKTGKDNIHDVWPNLELYMHGGVSFGPYRSQFQKIIPNSKMNYLETYNASEGFFGIQYSPYNAELLLMLDYGIYYEFIPTSGLEHPNETIIPLKEINLGENYAVVISTNSGLWRYIIGDTIRFTNTEPYRFIITGRTKHFINAFGEELMIANTDRAIQQASDDFQAEVSDYTVAPIYMKEGESGTHEWLIEFKTPPNNQQEFNKSLDQYLQKINSDYEAKRYKSLALKKPVIHVLPHGTFFNWLKSKGKLGGQHKVPRLSNNRDILEEILMFLS